MWQNKLHCFYFTLSGCRFALLILPQPVGILDKPSGRAERGWVMLRLWRMALAIFSEFVENLQNANG